MERLIRYQGAIIQDDQLLLIKHHELASGREYWILPGGGREPGESEEDCVIREMMEETGLTVAVERLLMEDADLATGDLSTLYDIPVPGDFRGSQTRL